MANSTKESPLSTFWVFATIGVAILICFWAYQNAQNKKQEKVYAQMEKERIARVDEQDRREAEQVLKQIAASSDGELKKLFSSCREAILKEAKKRNKGPFDIWLVDKTNADIYQFAAGESLLRNVDERVEIYRKHDLFYSSYAVISTTDTFSGPVRVLKQYSCEFGNGPKVISVR